MQRHPLPPVLDFAAAYSKRLLFVAGAALVVGYVLVRLSPVVLPVLLALLLAALAAPLVERLRALRVPGALAAGGVIVFGLVLVFGVIGFVGPAAAGQAGELQVGIQRGLRQVSALLEASPLGLSQADLQDRLDETIEQIRRNLGGLVGRVLTGATLVLNFLTGTVLTLFVLFFFLKDGRRLAGWFVGLVRPDWQPDAWELARRCFAVLGVYARGVIVVAVIDATFIGLALLLVGVPLVLPLAVLTFFGAFFPIVGAVVAGAVAVLVALVAKGFGAAVIVLVAVIAVQQIEGNVLYPMLVGSALHLHPVAIILALTAGGVLAGIVGALFAVPVAAVLNTAGSFLGSRARQGGVSVEEAREPPPEPVVGPGPSSRPSGGPAG
jgi:predicted PurR-regulated permease PerM